MSFVYNDEDVDHEVEDDDGVDCWCDDIVDVCCDDDADDVVDADDDDDVNAAVLYV
jgi:hypothetical protein